MPENSRFIDVDGDLLLLKAEDDGDLRMVAIHECEFAILRFRRDGIERIADWLSKYLEASKK